VVLRVFSKWLREEGYTQEHRLERLKPPKVPKTIVEVLTPDEVRRVLAVETPATPVGGRNHAMLVLALDTGLRLSETPPWNCGAWTWSAACCGRSGRARWSAWCPSAT
jgi:site-specific recombinase XerD